MQNAKNLYIFSLSSMFICVYILTLYKAKHIISSAPLVVANDIDKEHLISTLLS